MRLLLLCIHFKLLRDNGLNFAELSYIELLPKAELRMSLFTPATSPAKPSRI